MSILVDYLRGVATAGQKLTALVVDFREILNSDELDWNKKHELIASFSPKIDALLTEMHERSTYSLYVAPVMPKDADEYRWHFFHQYDTYPSKQEDITTYVEALENLIRDLSSED